MWWNDSERVAQVGLAEQIVWLHFCNFFICIYIWLRDWHPLAVPPDILPKLLITVSVFFDDNCTLSIQAGLSIHPFRSWIKRVATAIRCNVNPRFQIWTKSSNPTTSVAWNIHRELLTSSSYCRRSKRERNRLESVCKIDNLIIIPNVRTGINVHPTLLCLHAILHICFYSFVFECIGTIKIVSKTSIDAGKCYSLIYGRSRHFECTTGHHKPAVVPDVKRLWQIP